jgi:hypothetical protein
VLNTKVSKLLNAHFQRGGHHVQLLEEILSFAKKSLSLMQVDHNKLATEVWGVSNAPFCSDEAIDNVTLLFIAGSFH